MSDLKVSMYNVDVDYNGGHILFNTYTGSLVFLTDDEFTNLRNTDGIPEDTTKKLYDMGFLVDADTDELYRQNVIRKSSIFNDFDCVSGVFIAPTLDCNARCYYCYERDKPKVRMTDETVESTIDFLLEHLQENNELFINWFGGEPTIELDRICYIANTLLSHGVNLTCGMTTNGYRLDDEAVSRLEAIGLNRVQITIDAIGKRYEEIKAFQETCPEGPFEHVMTNIENILKKTDISVGLRVNFNPNRMNEAHDIILYLLERFGEYQNFMVYPAKLTLNSMVEFDHNETFELCKLIMDYGIVPKFDENYDMFSYSLLDAVPTPCYASKINACAIDPSGLIFKCHRLLGSGKANSVGDVVSGINYNETMAKWCNGDLPYKKCEVCPLLPCCQGGCKYNLLLDTGDECCREQTYYLKTLIRYLYEKINLN